MNKQLLTKENIVRIKSDKLFDKLKEFYEKFYGGSGVSKNKFFNDVIETRIDVYEKHEKDNWAFKNEKQTILDAIHEHTKRMNYFIKFSKPFIKNTYANIEIMLELITQMYNYMIFKMERSERKFFDENNEGFFNKLSCKLEKEKKKMFDYYDYEVELNQNDTKM